MRQVFSLARLSGNVRSSGFLAVFWFADRGTIQLARV